VSVPGFPSWPGTLAFYIPTTQKPDKDSIAIVGLALCLPYLFPRILFSTDTKGDHKGAPLHGDGCEGDAFDIRAIIVGAGLVPALIGPAHFVFGG
jgi:hypothetical protein